MKNFLRGLDVSLAMVIVLALLAVLSACGKGVTAPTALPAPSPAQTNNQNGCGNVVGNNNNVVCNATPSPTPVVATDPVCNKEQALYEQNVVIAGIGIPTGQSPAAHINALKTSLERANFKATSGLPLTGDEISIRIGDSFSETYDVCQGDYATTCTPQVLYQATCRPARK